MSQDRAPLEERQITTVDVQPKTARSGKNYHEVTDSEGRKYSCWQSNLIAQFVPNGTYWVGLSNRLGNNGRTYYTIEAILPPPSSRVAPAAWGTRPTPAPAPAAGFNAAPKPPTPQPEKKTDWDAVGLSKAATVLYEACFRAGKTFEEAQAMVQQALAHITKIQGGEKPQPETTYVPDDGAEPADPAPVNVEDIPF